MLPCYCNVGWHGRPPSQRLRRQVGTGEPSHHQAMHWSFQNASRAAVDVHNSRRLLPTSTAATSSGAASFADFSGEPSALRMPAQPPRRSLQPMPLKPLKSDAPRAVAEAQPPDIADSRNETALMDDGAVATAVSDLMSAEAASIEYKMRALNQELSLLGRSPRWRDALEQFDALLLSGPPPNAHVATTAIAIAGAHNDLPRAERIFNWFVSERQPPGRPTHQTYTALIQAYGRAGLWRRSLATYESMRNAGVNPTKYTISAIVAACARGGEEGAAAVEELAGSLLGEKGAPSKLEPGIVDMAVCTSLVSAFGRLRDWRRALRVQRWAQTRGLEADCHFYCALMTALTRSGQPDMAVQVFNEMSVPPNVHCYAAAIRALGRTRRWKDAAALFDLMQRFGVRPSQHCYGCLITAYEQAGRADEALALLAQMRADPDQGVWPSEVCVNAALSACAKAAPPQWEAAVALLREAEAGGFAGVAPSTVSYSTVVWACALAGRAAEAEVLYEAMLAAGLKPNDYTYSGLITAAGAGGGSRAVLRVRALRAEMVRGGVRETVHVYNALIAAADRSGDFARGVALYSEMRAAAIQPNNVTRELVTGAAQRGVTRVAEQQNQLAAFSAAAAALGGLMVKAGFL